MATNHITDLLSPYLDNQLSSAERQDADVHLDSCAECRVELESLRALVGALQRLPPRELPRSFVLGPRSIPRPAALNGDVAGFARALTSIAAAALFVVVGLSWVISGLPQRSTNVAAPSATLQVQPKPAAPALAAVSAPPNLGAGQAAAPAASAVGGTGAAALPVPKENADTARPAILAPSSSAVRQTSLDIPLFTGELALLLIALALGLYSLRWWRR